LLPDVEQERRPPGGQTAEAGFGSTRMLRNQPPAPVLEWLEDLLDAGLGRVIATPSAMHAEKARVTPARGVAAFRHESRATHRPGFCSDHVVRRRQSRRLELALQAVHGRRRFQSRGDNSKQRFASPRDL